MNGRKKAPTKFEDKKIDASIDTCCWITCLPFTFGAIPFKTIIYLDSEEVTKTDHYICGQSGESGQRRMGSDSQDDQRIGSGCGSDFSHTRASPASFPLPPPQRNHQCQSARTGSWGPSSRATAAASGRLAPASVTSSPDVAARRPR